VSEIEKSAGLYHGYADWKDWHGDFIANDRDARYFAAEFCDIAIAGKRVLEIGFGNGRFMAWAKSRGASIVGTEINEAMLVRAREKGFDAQPSALDALVDAHKRFDVVVAFDVFEHWDKSALIANLHHIAALLESGGVLVARFPNGQSPFGLAYQHGDITHLSALTVSSVGQLAQMTGFDIVRIGNAGRVPARRDPWTVFKFHWRQFRRARIERMIGKLYGLGRLALDPNLTAVLRKPS
jgi:2-polyprenyl-3-methyl-5-hydroxy-6-metoxy-1,4-benzoquinol methylase